MQFVPCIESVGESMSNLKEEVSVDEEEGKEEHWFIGTLDESVASLIFESCCVTGKWLER